MRLWHCSRILLELLNVWLFQRWFFRWWVGSWHWREFITAIVMFKQKLSTIWWKSKRVLIADRLIFLWRFLFFSTLWLRVCWNQSVQSIWAAGEKKLALVGKRLHLVTQKMFLLDDSFGRTVLCRGPAGSVLAGKPRKHPKTIESLKLLTWKKHTLNSGGFVDA